MKKKKQTLYKAHRQSPAIHRYFLFFQGPYHKCGPACEGLERHKGTPAKIIENTLQNVLARIQFQRKRLEKILDKYCGRTDYDAKDRLGMEYGICRSRLNGWSNVAQQSFGIVLPEKHIPETDNHFIALEHYVQDYKKYEAILNSKIKEQASGGQNVKPEEPEQTTSIAGQGNIETTQEVRPVKEPSNEAQQAIPEIEYSLPLPMKKWSNILGISENKMKEIREAGDKYHFDKISDRKWRLPKNELPAEYLERYRTATKSKPQ